MMKIVHACVFLIIITCLCARVEAKIYKYTGNTYKETALAYKGNVCNYFEIVQNKIFQMDKDMFTHFFKKCPVKKKLTKHGVLERYTLDYINPKYGFVDVNLTKPDRRTFSLDLKLTLFQDMPEDLQVHLMLYKYDNNVYKETALRYDGELCPILLKLKKTFVTKSDEFTQFHMLCPILKGVYNLKNYQANLLDLSMLPLWTFKCLYMLKNDYTLFVNMTVYFSIIEY